VPAGIQLGLGLALALLGVRIMAEQIWLAAVVIGVVVLFLNSGRVPAALVGLGVGMVVAATTGQLAPVSGLAWGLHLPSFALPGWADILRGAELAAIPQIPLTLTNAVIVTAAVTARYFPKEVHRVNERSLSLSTGIANLLVAPFGGYPMCHGAGGMAAHYRFGARSATAPTVIGITLLGMGLLLGDDATLIMTLVPAAVVGALLLVSGLELAWSANAGEYRRTDAWVVAAVAALGIAANLAIAFVVGLALAPVLRRLDPQRG
jgi:sulfate permease, SulP family